MDKKIRAWRFDADPPVLGYGDGRAIVAGETLSVQTKPLLCWSGLHGSERLINALRLSVGPNLSSVNIWGDVDVGQDKLCGLHRETLWMRDVSAQLHEFALIVAKESLDLYAPECSAGYAALAAKRAYLRGEITHEALRDASDASWNASSDAARAAARAASKAAARAAARDAAWTASRDVAWTAARAAAKAAARAAARDAAWTASRDAAWTAARDAQNKLLEQLLLSSSQKETK